MVCFTSDKNKETRLFALCLLFAAQLQVARALSPTEHQAQQVLAESASSLSPTTAAVAAPARHERVEVRPAPAWAVIRDAKAKQRMRWIKPDRKKGQKPQSQTKGSNGFVGDSDLVVVRSN